MVALEAIREALVDLDHDIDDLEDCISDNDSGIDHNHDGIDLNDHGIDENDEELDDQNYRLKRILKQMRRGQGALDEDRDALVLYCQQFAFAPDMVAACADILTCNGTRLPYRADIFHGNPYNRVHEDSGNLDFVEAHDHERVHEPYVSVPSSKAPATPGHYK